MTVETDAFEHRHIKPLINPCCFGEDFAAWLKTQIAEAQDCGLQLSDPIQEDYGWGFWASRGNQRYWIALSYLGDGPQEATAKWIISVTHDPGVNLIKRLLHKPNQSTFNELRELVREIVTSNEAIKVVPEA